MPNLTQLPQAASTSQIAIRLDTGSDTGQVELRIRERAGEVQIAVRSSDPEVASSLRVDLGDLVKRLDPRSATSDSFHSEAAPADVGSQALRHGLEDSSNGYSLTDDKQQRQRHPQEQQHQQQQEQRRTSQTQPVSEGLEELQNIINQLRNGASSL
jgi:hypothetical protein